MRNLFIRELIFLTTCAAVAAAYLALGYLLAPEIPQEGKIIRVTNIGEISESLEASKNAKSQRNAFFSAWIRWGMVGGVGIVVAISFFRLSLSSRAQDKFAEKKSISVRKSSHPLMSRRAWFYLFASAFLLFVLAITIAVGLSR